MASKEKQRKVPFLGSDIARHSFKNMDRNGDGKICRSELLQVMQNLSADFSEEDVIRMMEKADVNGDGEIDLEEFMHMNAAAAVAEAEDSRNNNLLAVFEIFDGDHDGFISADELLTFMQKLGEKKITLNDCREIIQSVDQNGDGKVDFDDFETMMAGA